MNDVQNDGGLANYMEQLHPEIKEQESKTAQAEQKPKEPEVAQPSFKKTSQEENWRTIRDRAEAAERRAAELERQLMKKSSQKSYDIGDDALVEGKDFKRTMSDVNEELQATRDELRKQREEYQYSLAEFKLKSQFNDFDNVVNTENLEKLAQQKPILYRSIMANGDLYEKGHAAYDLIKSAVLEDRRVYEQQDRRIEDNRNKPKSSSNVGPQIGETPLSRVGDYDRRILTEERKEQLRRQVEEAKRLR